jgi:hypothetical protein
MRIELKIIFISFSIDAATLLLINQRIEKQDIYGINASYFEDKNCKLKKNVQFQIFYFYFTLVNNFVNSIHSDENSSSQFNLKLNELNYNDFEKFKVRYESENKLKKQSLNKFNQFDDTTDERESYDFLFERKVFQNEGKNLV